MKSSTMLPVRAEDVAGLGVAAAAAERAAVATRVNSCVSGDFSFSSTKMLASGTSTRSRFAGVIG